MEFSIVTDNNKSTAVTILAEAFSDDAVMNWSCNHPESLEPFFDITLDAFVPHKLTYLDPQGRGAACWLGPSEALNWSYSPANIKKIFRLGGLKGIYRMILSGMATEKYHPKSPHYYLFAIGALGRYRGQGVGSSLIKHMLKQCDAEGVPAYLENSKKQNLAFYEGHGFKVMREIRFAKSAPPLWLMWREPVSTHLSDTQN